MTPANCLTLTLSLATILSYGQNYFPYCKEIPLELGKGFNISNPSEMKQGAFEMSTVNYDDNAAETEISYKLIENSESFNKQFGVAASLNARMLFKKLSANFQLDDKYISSGNYKTLVFTAKSDFGNKGFMDYKLKPEAQQLINESKFDDFIERYGTHFVQKTNTGVSLYVFLSYSQAYSEQENDKNGEVEMSGKILGGNATLNNSIKKAQSENQLHIEIFSNGPKDGLPSLSSIINSTEDPIETIKITIAEYLKKFSRENSKSLGYYYSSFTQFGIPKNKIQWNEMRENNLIKIKEEYTNVSDNITEYRAFKEECIYKKSTEQQKTEYETLLLEYDKYKDTLISNHKKSLNLSNNYYNDFDFKPVDIASKIKTLIEPMGTLLDKKLAITEFKKGEIISWTFNETCADNQLLKIKFKSSIIDYPVNLKITIDLEFHLNGVPFAEKSTTFTSKNTISVNEYFSTEGQIFQDLKFGIFAKNIKITDEEGNNYDSKIELNNMELKIQIE